MKNSAQSSISAKARQLEETVVSAHYLALELRQLALDATFIESRSSELLADLLHSWAKRQSERLEEKRPCFRAMHLVASNRG